MMLKTADFQFQGTIARLAVATCAALEDPDWIRDLGIPMRSIAISLSAHVNAA
jgi:hypothetical protein